LERGGLRRFLFPAARDGNKSKAAKTAALQTLAAPEQSVDYHFTRRLECRVWHGNTVSIILPTYNEKESIRECIEGFEALGIVDEILVINNNAALKSPRPRHGRSTKSVRATAGPFSVD
jgi:hypothetical protein